ncbi:MAG: DUF5615 family PIN-like protein [Planctomycetota bacterium]
MAETAIRLHLDESVTVAFVASLRGRGIDVTASVDAGLVGASDEQQLRFASSQGRVLITHDDDFLRMHHAGASHAGIGYCHQSKYSVGELLQILLLLHACVDAEEIVDCVEYL